MSPRTRRKRHEDHENHERWLVSYADFITLLFAFFVVMYAISSINEGKYRVLSDALLNAFRNAPSSINPVEFETRLSPGSGTQPIKAAPVKRPDSEPDPRLRKQTESMKKIAQDLLQVMAPLIKEGQVRVTQSQRGVTIEINAAVLFPPGSATLQGEPVKVLAAVAKLLAQVPNKIQVEGHTDDSPINTALYPSNWELSTARAASVVRLFEANGVSPDRLVAVGYADNRPLAPNTDEQNRARNRRVTLLVIAETPEKVKDIPIAGVLDGGKGH